MFMKKFLDGFVEGSTPMLYHMVVVGFSAAIALSLILAVRFVARQFLLHWSRTGEVRREKMNGTRTAGTTDTEPTNDVILKNVSERERNETFFPFWTHQNRFFSGDFSFPGRQNFQSGLHPGGKEFSLLRSKNRICETAGWIAIL
jgi:hypothetical protein